MKSICIAEHTETKDYYIILEDNGKFITKKLNNYVTANSNAKRELNYSSKKYKHFKGDIYKFICNTTIINTNEKLVVYQNISKENKNKYLKIYCRPSEMFYGKVDKKKYPYIEQDDRFEIITNKI